MERVCRSPAEGNLQSHVQMVEDGIGWAREGPHYGWILDVVRCEVKADNIVLPHAGTLVLLPDDCLTVSRTVRCLAAATTPLER